MNVVTVKFGRVQVEVDGHKISFSLGPGLPLLSRTIARTIARRVSSLIWVVLGERRAVVRGNCLQEGEGPVRRKRVLDGSA